MCSMLLLAMLLLMCLKNWKTIVFLFYWKNFSLGNGNIKLPDIPLNKLSSWHIERRVYYLEFAYAFPDFRASLPGQNWSKYETLKADIFEGVL